VTDDRPGERAGENGSGTALDERKSVVFDEMIPLLQRHNPAGKPIEPSTDLAADLNIDSVAAMDLIMELEERFDVDIPINLVSDLATVADLAALVERQLRAPGGTGTAA
jgi:acyl carrier protein